MKIIKTILLTLLAMGLIGAVMIIGGLMLLF